MNIVVYSASTGVPLIVLDLSHRAHEALTRGEIWNITLAPPRMGYQLGAAVAPLELRMVRLVPHVVRSSETAVMFVTTRATVEELKSLKLTGLLDGQQGMFG